MPLKDKDSCFMGRDRKCSEMKLIISKEEPDAIAFCPDILKRERCRISILHEANRSEWSRYLCLEAFKAQRKWETYRAYKNFQREHLVSFLDLPRVGFEKALAAYLQIQYMLGVYSELVFPEDLKYVCSSLEGNPHLISYPYDIPKEYTSIRNEQLEVFKTV